MTEVSFAEKEVLTSPNRSSLSVHLAKLPRRPASEDAFIRVLLKSFNPENRFVQDIHLPLPRINLKALPNDNGRIIYEQIRSEEAMQSYRQAKLAIENQISKDDAKFKATISGFFQVLDAAYQPSNAHDFTIGAFRKLFQDYQSKQDPALDVQDMKLIKRRLRPLETSICLKSLKQLQLLDKKFGVLSFSRTNCGRYDSQGFLTFVNYQCAKDFVEQFKGKLSVRGRKLQVAFAAQESLLGGYLLTGRRGIENIMEVRGQRQPQKQVEDEANKKVKRQLRRLRHKLTTKGLAPVAIQKIVDETVRDKSAAITTASSKRSKISPSESAPKKKKNTADVTGNPPNKILLVQNLPSGVSQETVSNLFQGEGFVEIRLVGVRNLAFVEYDSIPHASKIMDNLGASHQWGDAVVSIGFAK
ncbi:LANO_0G10990g1_1 [Lachancea nothofagi CBS 11611]|uniref:LANO_0G10990g1_1 n=1 Tax=Lachancea nothofagi CBS 11611 TaxID=1266666 RepID=A0A1G4KJ63_9SACH|nr:LANO_0G10990g1_1 [Lachancea nothofagi CBS 11611]